MGEFSGTSSRLAANVTSSIEMFGAYEESSGPYTHGWEIAFREGDDFRLIKEAQTGPGSGFLMFEAKLLRLVRSERIL
jgi:hypothetical protein